MIWRDIKYVQIPRLDGATRPTFSGADMHILANLFCQAGMKWLRLRWSERYDGWTEMPIYIKVNKKRFAEAIGIPLRTVHRAFKKLTEHGILRTHSGKRELKTYALIVDGEEVTRSREFFTVIEHGREVTKARRIGKSMLADRKHFTVPVYTVKHVLPMLKLTPKNVYMMLLGLLADEETPVIHKPPREIQRLCGIHDNRTFDKAIAYLAGERLIKSDGKFIEIMDAETLSEFPDNGRGAWRKYKAGVKALDLVELFKDNPLDYLDMLGIDGKLSGDGKEIWFSCREHDDLTPSASINAENSKWICHACGARGNIWTLSEIALELPAPYIVQREVAKRLGITIKYSDAKARAEEMTEEAEEVKANGGLKPGQKGVEVYDYDLPDGTHGYRKFRKQDGNGGKTFEIHTWSKWTDSYVSKSKNKTPLPPLLYRYPEASEVFFVEGEKDVHTLEGLGFAATTSGGSTSWEDGHADYFIGKTVNIIPDNDAPGETLKNNVIASLDKRGIKYNIIRLEEKDVSEYMLVHSAEEFKALLEEEQLQAITL